jgi:hypothetical protein
MANSIDGPASPNFSPVVLSGGRQITEVPKELVSDRLLAAMTEAPRGERVCWGIPFAIGEPVAVADRAVELAAPMSAAWLVFLHASDLRPAQHWGAGTYQPPSGEGRLGEHAADYVVLYADGREERLAIHRRRQIGAFNRRWGENCFEAVAHRTPHPLRAHHEQTNRDWGRSQTRVTAADAGEWVWWLWAWQNPRPGSPIRGLRFEPVEGTVLLAAVSAGSASSHPLRWQSRRKAVLSLGEPFDAALDEAGLLRQVRLDLGQIISATPQPSYGDDAWEGGYNNRPPALRETTILLEYAAHEDARFHLADGTTIPVAGLVGEGSPVPGPASSRLLPVPPAAKRITLRVVERGSGKAVPVKLHVHGTAGEYLAPLDRHRIPNAAWFEDYSVDFVHAGAHRCTYIPGETRIDVPLGRIFVEVSRGFEIRPVRTTLEVKPDTEVLQVELERVLPWRARGWVTADTHVHFLSPMSALLEGSAEGVNVVNLLASQWGELMTNVGDFDGRTTWGSREAGGDGEHLVRVGSENRQHVLGHISLLGYRGSLIAPMTTGGPDESALGDPVECLLTEWARQCRKQGGLVILPHFPNPRAEHAAAIVDGNVDGLEMTSWCNLYNGINPYSLADWYRYLNCGYLVAAVGGTDKMSADTAVGTVRTYARIGTDRAFDYASWMDAVRRAETFVTYGPLVEFAVEGKPPGSRIAVSSRGATLDVTWETASVTVPMSRVELVVNGEIRESAAADPEHAAGSWRVAVKRSSWLALLVRGHYADRPEIVAAHTSPVMAEVEGSPFEAAADAATILEQIEGAMAYLDTVGTRAETAAYRRMRLVLESAHRSLHNRMHRQGRYHEHATPRDHPEHH